MKSILITGTSGNLGQAVAEKFFSEGYHVGGTVRSGDAFAKAKNGAIWEDTKVDLQQEAAADAWVSDMIKKYKAIDLAVLTVGAFAMSDISNTRVENITQQLQVNFETAYNVVRPLFLHMQQQKGGKIYLIGSQPGEKASLATQSLAYGLAKSLLFRLAEALNEEGKEKNIQVKVIVPGLIDTPENRKAMPGADFSQWTKPEFIAGIIYSDAVATGTGDTIIHV